MVQLGQFQRNSSFSCVGSIYMVRKRIIANIALGSCLHDELGCDSLARTYTHTCGSSLRASMSINIRIAAGALAGEQKPA